MKQVVFLSGKGGTGKTVVTASMAALFKEAVFVDADVDAANLHILLHPEIKTVHEFYGNEKACVEQESCTACGACHSVCRFDALNVGEDGKPEIDRHGCEGCAVCSLMCPENAINMVPNKSGEWFESRTRFGSFIHGRLGFAEENSGKLVSLLRQRARETAEAENRDLILVDGPPGVGCPVIASLAGTDVVVLVTEPTVSGIHDMKRVLELTHHFKIKTVCCINKFDLNPAKALELQQLCEQESIPILGRIPFDRDVIFSLVKECPLVEYKDIPAARAVREFAGRLFLFISEEA